MRQQLVLIATLLLCCGLNAGAAAADPAPQRVAVLDLAEAYLHR